MINAPVVKAVQELLHERGIEQRHNELLGDYMARGLKISAAQSEALLEALHEGCTVEEAQERAGISVTPENEGLILDVARAVGTALGRLKSQINP